VNIKHLSRSEKEVFMSAEEIEEALNIMVQDASFSTRGIYKNTPSSLPLTFKEKHLGYLKNHPKVNPAHYLSNLRIALRVRP
jgi:hypothetical protein